MNQSPRIYDAIRAAKIPIMLLNFLQSTYKTASKADG
jgi:hypothetical protein